MEWLDGSSLGSILRESAWAIPTLGTLHLFTLTALVSGALLANLRVLGIPFRHQVADGSERSFDRLFVWGLGGSAVTGLLMLSGEALKCYLNPAFRWKMAALVIALVFSLSVRQWRARATRQKEQPLGLRFAAAGCLLAWAATLVAGRLIAFV